MGKTELLKIVQEMLDTVETLLEAILAGEEVGYESFYMSISLEMIANSRKWNSLRYWLRKMSWDNGIVYEITRV